MNRIPTEGLKLGHHHPLVGTRWSLNEQNPDRGIETDGSRVTSEPMWGLNEQNPDRGIETPVVNPGTNKLNVLE